MEMLQQLLSCRIITVRFTRPLTIIIILISSSGKTFKMYNYAIMMSYVAYRTIIIMSYNVGWLIRVICFFPVNNYFNKMDVHSNRSSR